MYSDFIEQFSEFREFVACPAVHIWERMVDMSVKRDLISVKRDLISVKRDLISVK
jgi:hypothetical protein